MDRQKGIAYCGLACAVCSENTYCAGCCAFASFVRMYRVELLLDCLEKNERSGMVYHYPGKLTGDYDSLETEEGIIHMILHGQSKRSESH